MPRNSWHRRAPHRIAVQNLTTPIPGAQAFTTRVWWYDHARQVHTTIGRKLSAQGEQTASINDPAAQRCHHPEAYTATQVHGELESAPRGKYREGTILTGWRRVH